MAGRRILAVPIFLLVSALLFLSIGPGSGVKATNYDTTYQLILSSTVPGAVTDVQTVYQVGADATVRNVNFGSIYSATGYPEANIVLDSAIVDGSSVGDAVNLSTLSIFNGPCSSPITVTVPFMDCTTDTLKTAPWVGSGDNLVQDNDGDMNEAGTPASPGTGNCIDGIDNDGDGDADGFDTDGVGGIEDPECNWDGTTLAPEVTDTNGLPTYCDHYPDFMNGMFNNVRPRARYMGHQVVVDNAPATMLDFVIFNPEALSSLPTVVGDMGDTYGFVDFVVLDNPVAAVSPSTITDFCIPLTSMPTLLGTTDGSITVTPGPEPYETSRTGQCGDAVDNDSDGYVNDGCLVHNPAVGAGQQRSENPGPLTGLFGTGTHVVRTYSISQRDVDNDGVSNNMDSCPYIPDASPPVDADGDGIFATCDPNDAVPSAGAPITCTATSGIPDYDQDCYPDRQDICPLVFDNQSDTDNPPGAAAADLGPGLDAIGDACDVSPNTADGHYHVAMPITAVCIPDPLGGDDTDGDGDADDDDDGWCDSTEVLLNSDPDVAASTPEHIALDLAIGTGAAQAPGTCSDFTVYDGNTPAGGYDNDGDGNANANDPDCAPVGAAGGDTDDDAVPDGMDNCPNEKNQEQVDSDGDGEGDECDTDDDGDGFTDAQETNIGTDPKDNCADDSSDDAWPLDFDQDGDADIVDVLKFKPVILKPLTPGGLRFDFDADGDADIVDVLKFKPYILTSCYSTEEIHANLLEDPDAVWPKMPGSCEDGIDNGGLGDGIDGADPDCQVDDITIQWKRRATGFISATDDSGGTWALNVGESDDWTWVLERIAGQMTSSETLTITYNSDRPVPSRCFDWSLGGVMKNSSHKPCSFRNDTGQPVNDVHVTFKYATYCCNILPAPWNNYMPPGKTCSRTFSPALNPGDVVDVRWWLPSRQWELENWYWTVDGDPVWPADKLVTFMYLDDATLYPNEGSTLPEGPAGVFTYPPIVAGTQYKVSVMSVDDNLGPYVPAKSNASFLADIPAGCSGVWDTAVWPFDIRTRWTWFKLEDPMWQLARFWDVGPEKVAGSGVSWWAEADLHFQPNDYGEWEIVGVPLNLLRFFDFQCEAPGDYTFTFYNKIEPKGHGFGDPNMTNNWKKVQMEVTVVP